MGEGMNGNSKGAVGRSLIVSSIQGLAPEVYFYGVGDSRVWCGPGPTQHKRSRAYNTHPAPYMNCRSPPTGTGRCRSGGGVREGVSVPCRVYRVPLQLRQPMVPVSDSHTSAPIAV